jgi:hypothetical protein
MGKTWFGSTVPEAHSRPPFALETFPLDTQQLGIHVQPMSAVLDAGGMVGEGKQMCRLIVDGDEKRRLPVAVVNAGLTIAPLLVRMKQVSIHAYHTDPKESKRGNVYSNIYCGLLVERQCGYVAHIRFASC